MRLSLSNEVSMSTAQDEGDDGRILMEGAKELDQYLKTGDKMAWLERAWRIPMECPVILEDVRRLAAGPHVSVVTFMATLVLFEVEGRYERKKAMERL
jgi:hypothetical protein